MAIRLEERNLIRIHGDAYRRYRATVPMLLPRPRVRARDEVAARPLADVR